MSRWSTCFHMKKLYRWNIQHVNYGKKIWRVIVAWLLLRLNEELFPNEGESIQQKPHSVDCGTPMKVRAPHDGLKHVCEFYLHYPKG